MIKVCLPHGWPPLGGNSRRRRAGERALRYTKFRMKMRFSPSVRYADSSLTEGAIRHGDENPVCAYSV